MFPADEYLNLAKGWASQNDEALLRCAISRAYYAVFHKSKLYAESKGKKFKPMSPKVHDELVEYFKAEMLKGNRKFFAITAYLGDFRICRNKCDYDNSVDNLPNETKKYMIIAEHIFDTLNRLK